MMSSPMATVLHVAPHPDDESIGAVATLLALRHAKHEVINLACSLGRLEPERRRLELETACKRAEFELIVHPPPLHISSGDDLAAAQRALAATVGRLILERRVDVVVSPSPHDGHHGHEMVGRAARDAVSAAPPLGPRLWMWGLWADLPHPTLYVGFDDERMARAIHVLEAHEGELERNDYRRVVRGRAEANRVLGSERVFGWGARAARSPTPSSSRRWSGATASGGRAARASSTRRSRSLTARARRCASAGGWTRRASPIASGKRRPVDGPDGQWPKRTSGRMRSSHLGRYHALVPVRRRRIGTSSSRTSRASRRTAMPRMMPISLGGSGPESAKVKNTATMTAPAAKITRPEWATPPTIASLASPVRSQCSLAELSRNTV